MHTVFVFFFGTHALSLPHTLVHSPSPNSAHAFACSLESQLDRHLPTTLSHSLTHTLSLRLPTHSTQRHTHAHSKLTIPCSHPLALNLLSACSNANSAPQLALPACSLSLSLAHTLCSLSS